MPKPRVIYEPKPGSPIAVDRSLYDRLAGETGSRTLVDQFVVPMRSGRAWPVRAGHLFRIIAVEGPQVADFNAWSLGNPRERFWAARTKQLHRAHVTTYDRLWSCLPYLRPMLTITNDTIRYGRDEDGAGCHDLLGTRCDPYVHKMLNGEDFDLCCHSNLVRAVAPYRLNELDIHDVLNIFQVTGLTADDRYFVKASPAKRGDFIEFFAEIDVLCAISTCPHGDLSVQMWGADAGDPLATCRPLGVERPMVTTSMLTIPARRGMAARVGKGQRIKVINTHGAQVVDTWAFSAADATEWMSMEASRAWFMKLRAALGDTFLTNQRRPILSLVEDISGGAHDTLMAACDAPRYRLLGVEGHHDNCRDNLHAGLAALGVKVPATPSPLNLFMNIPWSPEGALAWAEPVSTPGSYVVLRAEMDLVIAFSACPQDLLPINGRTGHTTEAHVSIE